MDKKNNDLLHAFIFAICVMILVYAGEQVKAVPASDRNSMYSWAFKSSAIFSGIAIISMFISFIPASKSKKYAEKASELDKKTCVLTEDFIKEKDIEKISKINELNCHYGSFAVKQNICDMWNKVFTYLSAFTLIISVVAFIIGVCLL